MNARMLLLGLVPLVALSCSSVATVKVNPGDQCFRCRRTISEPLVAGEIVNGGLTTKYRGAGCMAKYLAAHTDETGELFVTDFKTGKFIRPDKAVFVQVVVEPNTGETDYRAFKLPADATAAAAELKTTTVDWNTVLERAR